MNQIIDPMRGRDQGVGFRCAFLMVSGSRQLGVENRIDLLLDRGEFSLIVSLSYSARQTAQHIQCRLRGIDGSNAKKAPCGGKYRGHRTEHHRRQINHLERPVGRARQRRYRRRYREPGRKVCGNCVSALKPRHPNAQAPVRRFHVFTCSCRRPRHPSNF